MYRYYEVELYSVITGFHESIFWAEKGYTERYSITKSGVITPERVESLCIVKRYIEEDSAEFMNLQETLENFLIKNK